MDNLEEQQAVAGQQAYRELRNYLSANFNLAMEAKNDLLNRKAIASRARIRREFAVAVGALKSQMQEADYLSQEQPAGAARSDSILVQFGQVQNGILGIVEKADREQLEIRNMVAKRVGEAQLADSEKNPQFAAALNELNSRPV